MLHKSFLLLHEFLRLHKFFYCYMVFFLCTSRNTPSWRSSRHRSVPHFGGSLSKITSHRTINSGRSVGVSAFRHCRSCEGTHCLPETQGDCSVSEACLYALSYMKMLHKKLMLRTNFEATWNYSECYIFFLCTSRNTPSLQKLGPVYHHRGQCQ